MSCALNQINDAPFADAFSATELLFYLECAASALKSSVVRSRERGRRIIAPNTATSAITRVDVLPAACLAFLSSERAAWPAPGLDDIGLS
jgi:hypothetical protein